MFDALSFLSSVLPFLLLSIFFRPVDFLGCKVVRLPKQMNLLKKIFAGHFARSESTKDDASVPQAVLPNIGIIYLAEVFTEALPASSKAVQLVGVYWRIAVVEVWCGFIWFMCTCYSSADARQVDKCR